MVVSTVLCAAIVAPLFEIPIYMPVVAVFFSVFVSVLNVRALGETDLGPVSGIGKVSQLLFAVVAPGKTVRSGSLAHRLGTGPILGGS